ATLRTSRVRVVVKRMVGNALNSCGLRIARVVSKTTTASVRLAESKTSSSPGGIGITNTRIAPMMMTGKIRPDVRRQAVSRGLDDVGGIPSLHKPTSGQNDVTGPGGPTWARPVPAGAARHVRPVAGASVGLAALDPVPTHSIQPGLRPLEQRDPEAKIWLPSDVCGQITSERAGCPERN